MAVVVVPVRHTKECIIHNGHKYCESNEMTPTEVGYTILSLLILGVWLFGCTYIYFDKNNPRLAAALFFIPVIMVIVILLSCGRN